MKKEYETPELNMIVFESEDVITLSGTDPNTPPDNSTFPWT